MPQRIILSVLVLWAGTCAPVSGRTWTDSSGRYHVEADLIGFNETIVVLKKENRQLVAVAKEKLSKEDRSYLKSKEAADFVRRSDEAMQTWTIASGFKVVGKVVDYGSRNVTIQQRREKTYVNDRCFDNLPAIYQKILPKIVAHFEKTEIDDQRGFETWIKKLHGEPRTITCEGVMLELENGDEYGVPFFLFSEEDLKILQPGWERWLTAEKDRSQREEESFLLQTQSQAYQHDHKANQQIAMMQLQMQGYDSGMFDLWEVQLYPRPGNVSRPRTVVVPARDSRIATAEALRRNPGFVAGPVSRVSRKY